MKINKVLITTLLCLGVVSAADARQRHHRHRRARPAPTSGTTQVVPHHTLTPSLASATPGGLWSYNADLKSGQLDAGDGFTIFDFDGYVAGSIAAPVDWTPSTALTGSPFGASLGLDDPALINLTFTYNGPTINQAIGAQTFTGFTANTTDLGQVADDWASLDHDISSAPATGAQGTILVPSAVPDGGSTVALLGVALVGLEGLRRMVRTRKA
jgi:hypothetical protein